MTALGVDRDAGRFAALGPDTPGSNLLGVS